MSRDPYYSHGGIAIYHGDCREIDLGVRADHVITDPPYSRATQDGARGDGGKNKALVPWSIAVDDLRDVLARISPARWTVAFVDWLHAAALCTSPPSGTRFVRCGVWVKPDAAPQFTGDRPAMGWEAIAILHAADAALRWNGGGGKSVWTCNVERSVKGHPTPKPLQLVKEWISLFTGSGELIVDPFCGSGTTLRAAKDLGRRAIGIEIEERYCEVAAKRLAQEVLF